MPTRKSTSKNNAKPKTTQKSAAPKAADPKPAPAKPVTAKSPEYRAYEKRHAEMGEDRPKLTQQEFEEYEDELLDLLALNDREMSDDQIVRIQELEYLLIDAE